MNLPQRAVITVLTLALVHGTLPVQGAPPVPVPEPVTVGTEAPLSEERVPVAAVPPKQGAPRIESRLHQVAGEAERSPAQTDSIAARRGMTAVDGLLQVVVEADSTGAGALIGTVERLGGVLQAVNGHLVQALVPPGAVAALGAEPGVQVVRAPLTPVATVIEPEGTEAMGLAAWRDFGFSGRGAKVAVVDLGFDGARSLVGNGLPRGTVLRSFRADGDITGAGSPHGTAAAEIIGAIAPDVTLYLVNFATEVELANAVDWLISEGVQVISSSVGWPGSSYGDGAGTINEVIQRADRAGVTWVQASGNYGNTHWSGLFNDPDGNGFHNFGGSDEGNTLFLRRVRPTEERIFRVEVFLTWDDWDTFRQDYDLFLFQGDRVVAQSTAFQNGQFPPIEHIIYTSATQGDYWIAVQRFRATRRAKLDIAVTIDYNLEHQVPGESIVPPGDSRHAITVGAVEPNTLNLRAYSSQGPTKDGRTKPDLVAPDAVSTLTYGPRGFTGTSAAVPYVAAAAALIRGARSGITPAAVRSMLMQRAVGAGGVNNQIGAGYVALGDLPVTLAIPIALQRATLPVQ